MITTGLFTSSTDNWETPQSVFGALNKAFHFTLDVCASEENHKCARYFTKEQDGLKQDWGGERLYGAILHTAERLSNGWSDAQSTKEWQLC